MGLVFRSNLKIKTMYTITTQSAVTANANNTSSATIFEYPNGITLPKHPCEKGNILLEVTASAPVATDATVQLKHSSDGTNYTDVNGAVITISAATTYTMTLTNAAAGYYKTVYTKNSETTGTITTKLNFS